MSIATLRDSVNGGSADAFTEILPERKSSKKIAINWTPARGDEALPLAGALTIHPDRVSVKYAVTECAAPRSRGFALVKVTEGADPESELYNVRCGTAPFVGDECDCKGFTYKRTCKHVDACRALIANSGPCASC